jgi:hypothetical protein
MRTNREDDDMTPGRRADGRREHPKDEIEAALARISPDCSQAAWFRVAVALYDAFDDAGFDMFDAWSSQSKEGKYPGRGGCWTQWGFSRRYSVRGSGAPGGMPGGGITAGTLFFLARNPSR